MKITHVVRENVQHDRPESLGSIVFQATSYREASNWLKEKVDPENYCVTSAPN